MCLFLENVNNWIIHSVSINIPFTQENILHNHQGNAEASSMKTRNSQQLPTNCEFMQIYWIILWVKCWQQLKIIQKIWWNEIKIVVYASYAPSRIYMRKPMKVNRMHIILFEAYFSVFDLVFIFLQGWELFSWWKCKRSFFF